MPRTQDAAAKIRQILAAHRRRPAHEKGDVRERVVAPAGAVQPCGVQCVEKIEGELAFIRKIGPVAIVTGSYVTIPLTHRIAGVPLIWVAQSTWLEGFFKHGAGMTGSIRPTPLRKLSDFAIYRLLDLWMRFSLLTPLNRAARHYGVAGFKTMLDYWRGDLNLVAEPDDFTGANLPSNYHFVGPIVAQQDFPIPSEISEIPRDRPIVYFAMGSSGTPEIIRNIVRSFEAKQRASMV